MVAVTVSIDSSPRWLWDTCGSVNLIVFALAVFYEPHQVALQIFLQLLLPEE